LLDPLLHLGDVGLGVLELLLLRLARLLGVGHLLLRRRDLRGGRRRTLDRGVGVAARRRDGLACIPRVGRRRGRRLREVLALALERRDLRGQLVALLAAAAREQRRRGERDQTKDVGTACSHGTSRRRTANVAARRGSRRGFSETPRGATA